MSGLQHYDNFGSVRFVTFSCFRRMKCLMNDRAMGLLARHLDAVRQKHGFRLYGYVFMPEHVHLVLHPPEGMKMGLVVREMKSLSARAFFAQRPSGGRKATHVFWQRRCYDHNCRSERAVIEKINYCHNNPVNRGLVSDPGDWKWSSYNWFGGKSEVPLLMDSLL